LSEIEKSRLRVLVEEINTEHDKFRSSFKTTFHSAMRAGDLLNAAKTLVGHGNWASWVEENCEFSDRTARVYMRLANNRPKVEEMLDKSAGSADLSIDGVLRELAREPETIAIELSQPSPEGEITRSPDRVTPPSGTAEESSLRVGRKEYTAADIRMLEEDHRETQRRLRKLEESAREAQREAFDERAEDLDREYARELASRLQRAGLRDDPGKEPAFAGISGAAWREIFANIRSKRITEAMQLINRLDGMRNALSSYSPEEYADALMYIESERHRDNLLDTLQFTVDHLQAAIDNAEGPPTN